MFVEMLLSSVVFLYIAQFVGSSPSVPVEVSVPNDVNQLHCTSCLRNETSTVSGLNCSDIILGCEFCNSSLDCNFGICKGIKVELVVVDSTFYGLCWERNSMIGTVFQPDPVGKIISVALLSIFLAIVTVICLRICASLCSWRKCCVCQCTVSIHCCCEPKIPSLRVIPATGDQLRQSRDSMSPTPPPSYLDIYPDLAEDRPISSQPPVRPSNMQNMFPPISLTSEDNEEPIDQAEIQQQVSITHLDPYNLQSPERRQTPIPSLAHQDDQHFAPSLGSTLHTADDFEWSSVASFPCDRVSTPFPRVSPEQTDTQTDNHTRVHRSVSASSAPVRVFTISSRRGIQRSHSQISRNSIRPTTC